MKPAWRPAVAAAGLAVALFAGSVGQVGAQSTTGAQQSAAHSHRPVCPALPDQASDHARPRARCHSEIVTQPDGATPLATTAPSPGVYGPGDLQSAYQLPAATAGSGQTVAIVDAYDNPNAEDDLGAYRRQYGLPPCTTANLCFRKLNQSGATSPLPRADVGWGQEIALDLDMVSASCPNCKIVLIEANSSYFSDLGTGVNTAANVVHANAISNSYGGSEWSTETSYESYFNHPGSAITVSSGDDGYGAEFPASSRYVTAVGGTSLRRDSSARGWTETAWSGSGSGCSAYVTKPAWQTDTGCSRRTVADVSAVADPNTGVTVYDSYGSSSGNNWYIFGGTSAAAPIIAAAYAMGGSTASISNGSYPYSHTASLYDSVSGSNSTTGCTAAYLCTAGPGYDGPTGLGTPNGTGGFGSASSTPTTVTTTSTTVPATTSTTAPATTTTAPTTSTTAPVTTSTTVPPPASTQLVANPGFETGFSSWTVGGGAPYPVISTSRRSGFYSALLGTAGTTGSEPRGDSNVSQNVTIPSNAAKATLSFWYWPSTTDTVSYDWQEAQIRNPFGSVLKQVMKVASNARAWTQVTVDVTAYRGQTVKLWFNVHQDGYGDLTSMYLDDVSLAVS